MVGLFIDFLTSGLSFLKNLLGAYFMVLGMSSLLYFYLMGNLGYFFLKYLYFRPNDHGLFLL